MPPKKPHFKFSVGMYYLNRPEGWRGISRESWTFGKKPAPLGRLLYGIVVEALRFAGNTGTLTREEMQKEIDYLKDLVGGLEAYSKDAQNNDADI